MTYPGVHYHGHHGGDYDWRNDPKYNKDIEVDPRGISIGSMIRTWIIKSGKLYIPL